MSEIDDCILRRVKILNDEKTKLILKKDVDDAAIEKIDRFIDIYNCASKRNIYNSDQYFEKNNHNLSTEVADLENQKSNWRCSISNTFCSFFKLLFTGQFKSTITCMKCDFKSNTYSQYNDLSLAIPDDLTSLDLMAFEIYFYNFQKTDNKSHRMMKFKIGRYENIWKTMKKHADNISEEKDSKWFEDPKDYLLFYKKENEPIVSMDFEKTHCRDIPEKSVLILFYKISLNSEETQDGPLFKETIIQFDLSYGDSIENENKISLPLFTSFEEDMTVGNIHSIVQVIFPEYINYCQKSKDLDINKLTNIFQLMTTDNQVILDMNIEQQEYEKEKQDNSKVIWKQNFMNFVNRSDEKFRDGVNVYKIKVFWIIKTNYQRQFFNTLVKQRFNVSEIKPISLCVVPTRMKIDEVFSNFCQTEYMVNALLFELDISWLTLAPLLL